MEVRILISVIAFLVLGLGASAFVCPDYIYAFGDSLSDTGNAHAENALFYALTPYPYGESYRFPDRPCERTRFCDGRLIVDYTGTLHISVGWDYFSLAASNLIQAA